MAIRLADTAVPMNDTGYPIARAKHIWLDNDISLQKAIDDGLISGDDSTILTEQEYNELPEEEKIKGTFYLYDTGKIFKNSVQYGVTEPVELTYQEYSDMKEQGLIDPDQEYIVSADENGILLEASDIGYSNAVSNLPCTTVQGAIDKVAEKVDGLIDDTDLTSTTSTYSSAKIDERFTSTYLIKDIVAGGDNEKTFSFKIRKDYFVSYYAKRTFLLSANIYSLGFSKPVICLVEIFRGSADNYSGYIVNLQDTRFTGITVTVNGDYLEVVVTLNSYESSGCMVSCSSLSNIPIA